jgi:hypothetical protein
VLELQVFLAKYHSTTLEALAGHPLGAAEREGRRLDHVVPSLPPRGSGYASFLVELQSLDDPQDLVDATAPRERTIDERDAEVSRTRPRTARIRKALRCTVE